jgi:hypothetical protein
MAARPVKARPVGQARYAAEVIACHATVEASNTIRCVPDTSDAHA